jgi:hypothetical protein
MGATKFSTTTALALAAVVLSSSTTVFAVAKLPKHSVGAKQLKTSAVTNPKIGTHAVSNSKIGVSAVTSSKVKPNSLGATAINESALGPVPSAGFALTAGNSARLENKGSADFVGAPRMAFGKGNAVSTAVATVLTLPTVGMTVTTDGDADTAPEVEVNLPATPGDPWVVASEGGTLPMQSVPGGQPLPLTALAADNFAFSAQIWHLGGTAAIYLHCVFDGSPAGFVDSHPLSCVAFST